MLLDALIWFIQTVVFPLFGPPGSAASAMNLANVIGRNGLVILELTFLAFSTFDMTWIGVYLGLVFFFKGIQLVVSVYLFLKNLIPTA